MAHHIVQNARGLSCHFRVFSERKKCILDSHKKILPPFKFCADPNRYAAFKNFARFEVDSTEFVRVPTSSHLVTCLEEIVTTPHACGDELKGRDSKGTDAQVYRLHFGIHLKYISFMQDTAKIFQNGRSQAVRLPKAYRFNGTQVYIQKVGDAVLLLPYTAGWESLFNSLDLFTDDFMESRNQPKAPDARDDVFE